MSSHAAPPTIVVTRSDFDRLSDLAEAARRSSQVADYLAGELDRASLVDADQVAPTTVTMHSRFVFRDDARGGQTRTVSLVYPSEEDIDAARVSILTPIGAALLGLSEGQSIEWSPLHGAKRTLTVLKVLSQPSPAQHPS